MLAILHDVLPIFLMILLGWVIRSLKLVPARLGVWLGEAVFRFAIPVLLFRTLAKASFGHSNPILLWLVYFAGVAVTWTMAHLVATRLFRQSSAIGVVAGISSAFANNAFIGLPLAGRVLDEDGRVAVSILLAIHLPVMMIAGTVLMERATASTALGGARLISLLKAMARNLITNPLVIGLGAGALVNQLSLPIPTALDGPIWAIGEVASPLALISIGMSLTGGMQSGQNRLVLVLSVLKLLLLPASIWCIGRLVGLNPVTAQALVLTSSVPSGINAFLIASRFRQGEQLAASTIFVTTVLGAATVSLITWLVT